MPERHAQRNPTALLFYPREALRQGQPQHRQGRPGEEGRPATHGSATPAVAPSPTHLPAPSSRHRARDAETGGRLLTTPNAGNATWRYSANATLGTSKRSKSSKLVRASVLRPVGVGVAGALPLLGAVGAGEAMEASMSAHQLVGGRTLRRLNTLVQGGTAGGVPRRRGYHASVGLTPEVRTNSARSVHAVLSSVQRISPVCHSSSIWRGENAPEMRNDLLSQDLPPRACGPASRGCVLFGRVSSTRCQPIDVARQEEPNYDDD
jgi:hypothetical protein